jgi:hypothetical protein
MNGAAINVADASNLKRMPSLLRHWIFAVSGIERIDENQDSTNRPPSDINQGILTMDCDNFISFNLTYKSDFT